MLDRVSVQLIRDNPVPIIGCHVRRAGGSSQRGGGRRELSTLRAPPAGCANKVEVLFCARAGGLTVPGGARVHAAVLGASER